MHCNNYLMESKYVWFRKFKIKRRTVATINRIRSGHISLRESLLLWHNEFSIVREMQRMMQTPNHVFWECSAFTEQRRVLQNALASSLALSNHMATIDEDSIYILNTFLY